MVNSWQKSLAAALFAASIGMDTAQGSPAGMASSPRQSAAPAPSVSQPIATAPRANPSSPSTWQRIANAMPDVRVPWGSKSGRQAPPATYSPPVQNDSISLSRPTGPVSPQLLISLAQISEQQGDIAQARQHYQRALAQWPGHVEVLRAAAYMEDRLGQLPLAESLYQQAVAGKPGDASALNDLGLCLARQGKLEQSVQVFEQAIHIQPDKALFRNNVATVLVEMRQDQRAIGHLAAVHGDAETQFNMGQLMVARSRTNEAEAYFKAALDAKPGMTEATTALAQLPGRQPQQQSTLPASAAPSAQAPAVAANSAPAVAPAVDPQTAAPPSGPQLGPQMNYPSEARTPAYGRSTYSPSAYQPPVGPYPGGATAGYPQPNVPWVGQATPRALPPVGGAASAGIRR